MSCPTSKCLCERLILSQAVTFSDNNLIINIPAGSYADGEKYCIVVAQNIPTTTTIAANVVITIGTDTTTYPLVNCDCTNVQACQIQTKKRYSTVVHTNIQSGVFKLMCKACSCNRCQNNAASLPIPTTTATEVEENA